MVILGRKGKRKKNWHAMEEGGTFLWQFELERKQQHLEMPYHRTAIG